MVHARFGLGSFEFVFLSALRVAQLARGCTARVPSGHKHVMTAQLEVAAGLVAPSFEPRPALLEQRPAR
jgi:hypothetical protein